MRRFTPALALVGLLAACGGDGTNPFDDGTTGDTGDSEIPDSLAGDLQSFSYDADNQTLTVTGITQDSSPISATYTRNPALDTAGYEAYSIQDDALSRHAIALVRESGNSGSVRAGVVSTGGQFNRIHHGGYYERSGSYTQPTTGTARYAGTYAGLTNVQVSGDLVPPGPGTPPEVLPGQAARTEGNVLINADFNDGSIEGTIYDREIVDTGDTLPSIVLVTGEIADDGTFFGEEVEYDGDVDNDIGDYGGIFGGPDAESVGGVVNLDEFDDNTLGFEGEVETGVFVLESCDSADATSPLCP
ncbi:thymidylate synthase [Rhodobacteraceae bacterium 63075]|nr:thymidylate synthase [Rhodobacteraceae bacterium 63075]